MKFYVFGQKRFVIGLVLVIFLGALVYTNSLKGEFVWDDDFLVKNNPFIKSARHWQRLLFDPLGASTGRRDSFYRPLQMVTYAADHALWKLNPFGYHLTNVFLHISAAVLVSVLIFALFNNAALAILTGAFFVAHPIHTEAVSYISGRADPLALVWMLTSLLAYIRYATSGRLGWIGLCVTAFVFSLLSRENSFFFPAFLILYHVCFRRPIRKSGLAACLIVLILYLVGRALFLRESMSYPDESHPFLIRLPGFFVAYAQYLRLLILPLDLHMEYENLRFSWINLQTITGFLLFAGTLFFLRRHRRQPIVSFSIGWFLLALMPVSNLYPIKTYMAEHWMYVPSIGFFLLLSSGITQLNQNSSRRIVTRLLTAGLLAGWGALTVLQNNTWRTPLALYERLVRYAPTSARVLNNLGMSYHQAGRNADAIKAYDAALRLSPNMPEAHNNLGVVLFEMDRIEESLAQYQKAVSINPRYADAYFNMGGVYSKMGRSEDAIRAFRTALDIAPSLLGINNNLGVALYNAGKTDEALAIFQKIVDTDPSNVGALNNLANLHRAAGHPQDATILYQKIVTLDASFWQAYHNLGLIHQDQGQDNLAIENYKAALSIKPDLAETLMNLGMVYARAGEMDESITTLKKAIAVNPDYAQAHYNLAVAYWQTGNYALARQSAQKAKDTGYAPAQRILEQLNLLSEKASSR